MAMDIIAIIICFDLRPVMTHVESDDAHAPHVRATLHDYLYNVCTWSYSQQVYCKVKKSLESIYWHQKLSHPRSFDFEISDGE